MANRNKKESIAFFIKDRLDSGSTKNAIAIELDTKLKAGEFKSKQTASALVVWYANYFRKQKSVVAIKTEDVNAAQTSAQI